MKSKKPYTQKPHAKRGGDGLRDIIAPFQPVMQNGTARISCGSILHHHKMGANVDKSVIKRWPLLPPQKTLQLPAIREAVVF